MLPVFEESGLNTHQQIPMDSDMNISTQESDEVNDSISSDGSNLDRTVINVGQSIDGSSTEGDGTNLCNLSSDDASNFSGFDEIITNGTETEDAVNIQQGRVRDNGRRYPQRDRKKKAFKDFRIFNVSTKQLESDPATYAQAMLSKNCDAWKQAMNSELEAFQNVGAWELVKRPSEKKPISSRWGFQTKEDSNSGGKRFKARLTPEGVSKASRSTTIHIHLW